MINALQNLINSLREELTHYGEMLALLDKQQDLVIKRSSDEVLQTVADINAQSNVVQTARLHRQSCLAEVAATLNQPADAPFAIIIPLLPPDYRPLVQALVEENNALLVQVQQRLRQNHLLLSRSVELLQRLISNLFPSNRTTTYTETGGVFNSPIPSQPLYEAVG